MATQRPGGTGPTAAQQRPPHGSAQSAPRKPAVPAPDLAADTAIWHTRGLQTNSRMRAPLVQRTPVRQLPPSPVPRLILWAVLIGIALVCFQTVKHMLR